MTKKSEEERTEEKNTLFLEKQNKTDANQK